MDARELKVLAEYVHESMTFLSGYVAAQPIPEGDPEHPLERILRRLDHVEGRLNWWHERIESECKED